jgi:hypothetical protein
MKLTELDKEIALTEQRLATLKKVREMLAKLEGAPAAPTVAKEAKSSSSKVNGARAPKGALEAAILAAVEGGGGLVNREVRAKVKQSGYKFSLSPLHVGKTLTRMVQAKALSVKQGRAEYSKAGVPA